MPKGNSTVLMSDRTRFLLRVTLSILLAGIVVCVVVVSQRKRESPVVELRELTRDQLELRENGVLCVIGENEAFDGILVEYYPGMKKRIAIEISAGRAHGVSRGWYENGQQEVEERFIEGVSNGRRTRWHENGTKKSESQIVGGVIMGMFTKWHDNGQRAAEVTMLDGKADCLSQSWYRSGTLKSRVELRAGEIVDRQYWESKPGR
jgi:antitoxin component YwqK of YwqJK toxin-antitoxin module